MKRIVIVGADSYVGTSVEQYLRQWPDAYEIHTIDTRETDWETVDFSGTDCVFHVAGIAHADIRKLSEERKQLYYKVNTELAIVSAQKAKESGVKQFIFMSTANVYGESVRVGKTKRITKETPLKSVNVYSDSKIKAEEGLRTLEDATFQAVILRCPMIYGKGCKGNYVTLSKMARKLPIFPKVKNARSMIYIENLAEFVRLMIENEERGVFCPCDRENFCTSDVVKRIASIHGKRIILVPGVTWGLKIMGTVFETVNKAFGNFVYDASVSEYKEDYRVYTVEEAVRKTEV